MDLLKKELTIHRWGPFHYLPKILWEDDIEETERSYLTRFDINQKELVVKAWNNAKNLDLQMVA